MWLKELDADGVADWNEAVTHMRDEFGVTDYKPIVPAVEKLRQDLCNLKNGEHVSHPHAVYDLPWITVK